MMMRDLKSVWGLVMIQKIMGTMHSMVMAPDAAGQAYDIVVCVRISHIQAQLHFCKQYTALQ